MSDKQFYKCVDCGDITDNPTIRRYREYDGLDSPPYRYSTVMTCDACDSEDLEEVVLCIDCLECGEFTEATHDDFCKPHHDEENASEREAAHDFRRDQFQPVRAKVRA